MCFRDIILGVFTFKKRNSTPNEKIDAILALSPPTKVKELRTFLGMVQYYRDMWKSRSKMLAPLTDLVGECGQTKSYKS